MDTSGVNNCSELLIGNKANLASMRGSTSAEVSLIRHCTIDLKILHGSA